MSQTDLARKVGISSQAVQQWEAGKTCPRGKRIIQLARVLGIDPVWLQFEGAEAPEHVCPADFVDVPIYGEGKVIRLPTMMFEDCDTERLTFVRASNDCMSPLITNGAIAAADTSQIIIEDGAVFAFLSPSGRVRIKRFAQRAGGGWAIQCDNQAPNYKDEIIDDETARSLPIIGRVLRSINKI